ncbi:MAG: hypothetical protein QJR03_07320 [Sphaerobacter sp.]|nr:hypothetical protein [Sphaerobacter sp.]
MDVFFGSPLAETIGLIVGLGVASVAGWTANRGLERSRRMQREVLELREEIRRLRREVVTVSSTAATAAAPLESIHERVTTLPGEGLPLAAQRQALPFGRSAGPTEPPDVKRIAEQLGVQSPEAIEHLLSGQMSLGAAARELGTGRQEARLLYWLHGRGERGQVDA